MQNVFSDLKARGLIHSVTDEKLLAELLQSQSVCFYIGFDPTAPSLHIGNLVQIITAKRLQLAGHKPLALVGGATGLIGDPKQSGERVLNEREVVDQWVKRIHDQLTNFFDFAGTNAAIMVNNYDWTAPLGVLEFLRDIGKHFPVNKMLDREAVAARLAKDGISFTEFSYQVLQANDFLHLFQNYGAVLQTGGSDQWGNLTAGTDLIRRVTGASVHAMCTPLLVKADGGKFGKTESGTIWLDSEMTSPYAFYQFWINTDDRDLELMLNTFSLKSLSEIEQLMNISNAEPHLRHGQKSLAMEMTSLVHSEQAMLDAQNAASALFAGGDLSDINKSTLHAALQEAGLAKSILINNQMPSVVELLLSSGVVGSKNEAKRAISEGSIWINQTRISTEDQAVAVSELIHGAYLVVRKGKKTIRGLEF